ncbi:DUF2255 family protein [Streptomyces sp. NPDC046915]|uniref:DUF2255 family protein n=1 Tax=Streptomyces sp. NPDC046915 TaxID=3155257 RepID=UPI0033EBE948
MTTWTDDELNRIASADELRMAPRNSDGSLRRATTIWVVREGDELYVRSWRGTQGGWWRTAHSSHAGHVTAGGVEKEITLTEVTDPDANARIDDAYRSKYGHYSGYVEPMVAEQARVTTLRLLPQR